MNQLSGLPSNAVRCVMLDNDSRVWTGTDNGLSILNANSDAQKNIIKNIGNKSIWGINFIDSLVFIGSRFDGLFIFNRQTGKLVEQYPSTIITLIRKIKVFDRQVFILSNNGAYLWMPKKLTPIKFTENINADFPTDLFTWQGQLYALVYPGRSVIQFSNNSFEKDCTKSFIPEEKHNSLLCAQSTSNKLVIGGDRFYTIIEQDGMPQTFYLTGSHNENWVVLDIAIIEKKIVLALGENNSSQKGVLYMHGNPFISNDSNGFLTSLSYDSSNDCLYYGDLARGLFLQKSVKDIALIGKEKQAKIIANKKHILMLNENSINKILLNRSQQLTNALPIHLNIEKVKVAKLFGDTLALSSAYNVRLYNAGTFKLIKNIPIPDDLRPGLVSMELLGDKLYLFHNYQKGVNVVDLPWNKVSLLSNIESFLPATQMMNDKIIFLNKEKGFNVIEKDTAYALSCTDKRTAFAQDFTLIKDTLYILVIGNIHAYKIDYSAHQLVPVKSFELENKIEGFTAKWILSKNNKLYLLNDKGIMQIQQSNGVPVNYYYFGNYNQVDKPVIAGNTLLLATSSLLTSFAFSDIDTEPAAIDDKLINLQYPEAVNENLGFTIGFTYRDWIIQNHSLKTLEIKRNGELISRKYTIHNQFNLANGLKYGEYDLAIKVGNSTINQQINISLPLNRNPWFFGAIILFVLVTLSLLIKSRLDKKEFNKKLSQNRLQVLKQNLNPHFVFNSMNLISSLILEKQYDKAIEVVAEFSNLQRTYLETNNKAAITLTEELSFLNSYLKLQHTRFEHDKDFSYQINVSPGIDTDSILLPPLILQPLAENAIKYGVIGSSESNKKIWIEVGGKQSIIIGLEDNGKEVEATHKGFGLGQKLVEERIHLFNQEHKVPIQLFLHKPALHSKTGYRVEVHIG